MEHNNYYIYYIFITGLSLLFCIIFYRTIFYIISLNQMASKPVHMCIYFVPFQLISLTVYKYSETGKLYASQLIQLY